MKDFGQSLHINLCGQSFKIELVLKRVCIDLPAQKLCLEIFLATLKQITQSCSSCITDCHHDFEKGKHLQNTYK